MSRHKDFLARVEVEDQHTMRGVIAYVEHPGDAALAAVAEVGERLVADAAAVLDRWSDDDVRRILLGLLALDAADVDAYDRECRRRGLMPL